jgi:copper(I)-binding protein
MLNGLKAPLKAGETVPLMLSIKVANKRIVKVETKAEVKPLTATNASPEEDEHLGGY